MAETVGPSGELPRTSPIDGPATLPVRGMNRFVDGDSIDDLPTDKILQRSAPKTPQPRETPPVGSVYPSIPGYEVIRQLGRGGMGVVYLAREVALNRWVALKVMVGGVFAGSEALDRFHREAEAVAALQHPNIIQIFNIGVSTEEKESASACPFIALEYADGGTLAAHTGKPMTPRIAAEIVATLADAVQYAHSRGIVHRDMKPGNVLMQVNTNASADNMLERLTPKVTDFGLAKRFNEDGTENRDSQTMAGSTLGTPEYMAPEQAHGDRNIGPAADVYALGVILFELLTARVPLQGADGLDTLVMVRMQEAPPPSRFESRLPKDLDTICLRCLQKDPSRRYSSAESLANDLRAWLDHRPIAARPTTRTERVWKWTRRHPAVASLLGAVLVVGIAGFLGVFSQWQRAEARAASEKKALQRASASLAESQNNLYFGRISVAQRELAVGNPWDAIRLLDLCRPKNDEPDLRSWEWPYLKNASKAELFSFHASDEWVWDIAYSPDGAMLATAAGTPYDGDREKDPGEVRLWDAQTGKLIRKFDGPKGTASRVAFSPDGKFLCSCGFDKTLRVWDVATAKEVCESQPCQLELKPAPDNFGHAGPCWFTADSKAVEFRGPDNNWRRLGIANNQVTMLPAMNGAQDRSADGRVILIGRGGADVEVFDLDLGRAVTRLEHAKEYNRLALCPTGRTVLMSHGEHMDILDSNGKRTKTLNLNGSWIETISFSPDCSYVAAAGSSRLVHVWDHLMDFAVTYAGHRAEIRGVAFSPDGQRIASCDRAGQVFVWDVNRNPLQKLVSVGVDASFQMAQGFTADGEHLMTVMGDTRIMRYNRQGKVVSQPKAEGLTRKIEYPRLDITFSPDGIFLAGPLQDEPNVVRIWDTTTGKVIREIRGHQNQVMGTAWSRDGKRLATRSLKPRDRQIPTEVIVWDVATGEKISTVTTEPIVAMALSGDGTKLGGGDRRGQIFMWDVASGKELWRGIAHRPPGDDGKRPSIRLFASAFSPDDKLFATGGYTDGCVQLWNSQTGVKIHEPLPLRPTLTGVAFTPDGRRVAGVGYDSEVRMWDVATGQLALTLSAPVGGRRADLAYTARPVFSQNNQQFAILVWNGVMGWWDGREVNTFTD